MNGQISVKHHLITCWPHLQLNFWIIPKSGSTSVLAALLTSRGQPDVDQLDAVELHSPRWVRYIPPELAKCNGHRNITMVRDPYQRAISLYKDFGLRRNHKRMIRDKSIDKTRLSDLDYFIDRQIVPSLDHRDNLHVRSQHWYLLDQDQKLKVDMVYKIENIAQLFSDLGLQYQHLNSTHESISLTATQRHKIYTRYQKDFELFGYLP